MSKDIEDILKTLSRKTSLKELEILEKDHHGIIIAYWRKFYLKIAKFIGVGSFWEMMETKPEAVSVDDEDEDKVDDVDVDALIAEIKRKYK